MSFIGTYRDDELIVFHGKKTHEWLTQWLFIFQCGVDRLLQTQDIQFTMEIWSPGEVSRPIPETEILVLGIGQFHRVTINGGSSFPYLDIKLSWNEDDRLNFNVNKKPNKLVNYLNTHSQHHSLMSGTGQASSNNSITMNETPPSCQPSPNVRLEENCATLAQHLFSHVRHLHFTSLSRPKKVLAK
jgi:hypothetical protein